MWWSEPPCRRSLSALACTHAGSARKAFHAASAASRLLEGQEVHEGVGGDVLAILRRPEPDDRNAVLIEQRQRVVPETVMKGVDPAGNGMVGAKFEDT